MNPRLAADWTVSRWFNTGGPLSLADLRGRVVLAAAFQMRCPGCVEHTVPQLRRAHAYFPQGDVAVAGLHTVFENHEAQRPDLLAVFLEEAGVSFPVGVDQPSGDGPVPVTMGRYAMQGTPTLVLIDRQGRLRRQTFGHIGDLQLGAEVMSLMREDRAG